MTRTIDKRELTHERLGDEFETALSRYDTDRRIEVLVDEFLGRELLQGAPVLDVGCGLGDFSQRLADLGAQVTACDLGPGLVERTRARVGCKAVVADVLNMSEKFEPETFDIVHSSECIEHTPDPMRAVGEMARLVKPGGYLCLSTPNQVWWPVVKLATVLKLRPFDGYENFSSWSSLCQALEESGLEVTRKRDFTLSRFSLASMVFRGGLMRIFRLCEEA